MSFGFSHSIWCFFELAFRCFCPGDIYGICISDTFISSCVSHDKHVVFQLWTFIGNLYSVSVIHFWCLLYFFRFVFCYLFLYLHFSFFIWDTFLWLYFCLFLFLFLHFYFIPFLLWLPLAPASPPRCPGWLSLRRVAAVIQRRHPAPPYLSLRSHKYKYIQ